MAWYNIKKKQEVIQDKPQSYEFGYPMKEFNPIYTDYFDGEKTPGELGSVYDTKPEYLKLRLRSYDAYLKTNILRVAFGKVLKGIIGSGLKLQSEPVEAVLRIYGIDEDLTKFRTDTEALFNLYASTVFCDYHKMENLHDRGNDALKDSNLGGDSLMVLRVDEQGVNVQILSGGLIQQPYEGNAILKQKGVKNRIIDGVEVDNKGTHVAYYVSKYDENNLDDFSLEFERVKAKDSKGRVVAKLIYGEKNRINDVRGIPKTTSVLEKVNKLDRYDEAIVSKAEKSANIIYSIEHKEGTGESDPRVPGQANISKKGTTNNISPYEQGQRTANQIKQTTSGETFNMPEGSSLNSFQGAVDANEYSGLSNTILTYICASIDVPVEVALQAYNSNYSASRAAINAWEQILEALRKKFARDFYVPFYKMYLDYMILSDMIVAPGYLKALRENNHMVLEAYSNSRWIGQRVPHIDPLKEVKAVQIMLELNLISQEQAVEILNMGSWEDNYKKFLEEGKIKPIKKEQDGE